MPTYSYKARGSDGGPVAGTLVADTEMAAARMLDERRLMPIELREVTAQQSLLTGRARRISVAKIGHIYEQLADLLRAGVPVLRALSVLSRQSSDKAISRVLREVHDDVAGGDSLADSMEKHPQAFPHLHVSMVRAGEKGGFLEDVLTRIAEFVARQDALKNKFLGSMIYPCILVLAGLIAVTFLMSFVVPKVRTLIESQKDLPWATHVVFAISDALSKHYVYVAGGLLAIVIALTWFFQSELGRHTWAKMQLRMWGIGRIYTMVALCRFCRIFGTLLANGIPIIQALRVAKDSAGNEILCKAIDEAAEHISAGESLATPLGQAKIFPPAMLDMIAVAEESNTLEKVLIEIANTQEERTARQIDLVVRMIEPMMIMLLGLMVMFIALALLLPILRMSSQGIH